MLGLNNALVARPFAEALVANALRSAASAASNREQTPGLISDALNRMAAQRVDTAKTVARLGAENVSGWRDALLGGVTNSLRSIDAAQAREAAAREGGRERGSRERIAGMELDQRAAEAEKNRLNAVEVANIGADARRDVAGTNHGERFGAMVDGLAQGRAKAVIRGDAKAVERIDAELQRSGKQLYSSAETPEEQQQVLRKLGEYGVTLTPAAAAPADTPPRSWMQFGQDVGGIPGSIKDSLYQLGVSGNQFLTGLLGGSGGGVPSLRGSMLPRSAAPPSTQPFSMDDFYRSLGNLPPPPTTQPLGGPPEQLLRQQADPFSGYDWSRMRR